MNMPAQAQPLGKIEKVNQIVARRGGKVANLVGILQDVQGEYRYLPEEVMSYVATALDIPASMVFGVATFYTQFTMTPRGRYVIKVCDGTACHVRGSEELNFVVQEATGLPQDGSQSTTTDLKFTVERVACVGACGLAPVIMVDDKEVFGNVTPEEARQMVERLTAEDDGSAVKHKVDISEKVGDVLVKAPATKIRSREDLEKMVTAFKEAVEAQKVRIMVCMSTACVASGAREVYAAFRTALDAKGLRAELKVMDKECGCGCGASADEGEATEQRFSPAGPGEAGLIKAGCFGYCQLAPHIVIDPGNVVYSKVTPEDIPEIISETIEGGRIIDRLLYKDDAGKDCTTVEEIPFYASQQKVALTTCGKLDCEDIREYMAFDGYTALAKAIFEMTPEEVINEISTSGLRGRGGGGFPTGIKWTACREATGSLKYIVCNADEGDPGAFMDRSLLEGDPHRVLEGILLAAYAVGAEEAYIYARAEYPLAVMRLHHLLEQAKDFGLLGKNIMGSDFSLEVKIKEGAGAFVCGEETALLASIEGQRGMPRPRPPFPATSGLWGKPTIINNVETLAIVPYIIKNGAANFRKLGTEKSPGTKTFALAGQVARTGLVEVPLGTTLREIVFDIGGGMRRDFPYKSVQIGGPSGGCLTMEHLDMPLDYERLREAGAMVGSGGLVVMDGGTCMVEIARYFMGFIQDESCGKCVPCREGTKKMLEILKRITGGRTKPGDLELLEELAGVVAAGSLCGLGKTAANPVLSTLRYFRDEYRAHIEDKKCPAGVCQALLDYIILPEPCTGCGACIKVCPVDAIQGERKQPHTIDVEVCTRCGACVEKCKFEAIIKSIEGGHTSL